MEPPPPKPLLDTLQLDKITLCVVLGCSAATLVLCKWVARQKTLKKIQRARKRRDCALLKMARAVERYKQQGATNDNQVAAEETVNDSRRNSEYPSGKLSSTYKLTKPCQGSREDSLVPEKTQRERSIPRSPSKCGGTDEQNADQKYEEIVSLSLKELLDKLKEGGLSPDLVLYSYMQKALEVHKQTNCLTDFLHECETDVQVIKQQKEKGLLYGVPVSIKEHFGNKGHVSTCGLTYYVDNEMKEDCIIVQVLKKQGAIPFVLTNVPQSMMSFDCSNTIFGQTTHPMCCKKTPGGSSGGEGALVGGGGSILGFGSDIAGSIRVPSSFCGLCGLKPTGYRLSLGGITAPVRGITSVVPMIGPMARDVDSLALSMKALLCDEMFYLDPTVPPIPFREEIYNGCGPLRIGFYVTDGYTRVPPSVKRAVMETKKLLEKGGHTLVPFTPPRIEYMAHQLFTRGIYADGAAMLKEKFKGEIVDPSLKRQVRFYRFPKCLKRLLSIILKLLYPRISKDLKAQCGRNSARGVWEQNYETQLYCKEFIQEWRKLNLDVVLCPVMGPAYNLGYLGKLFGTGSYTYLYNVLNFPAGVVPVTAVTEQDECELGCFQGYYEDCWDKLTREALAGSLGLPIAVQCVALPWQEELCLRFMKEVETLVLEEKKNANVSS